MELRPGGRAGLRRDQGIRAFVVRSVSGKSHEVSVLKKWAVRAGAEYEFLGLVMI